MRSLTPFSFYLTSAHLTRTMTILLPTQNPCLKILVQLRVLSHFKLVILYMFGRGLWNLKRHNLSLSFVFRLRSTAPCNYTIFFTNFFIFLTFNFNFLHIFNIFYLMVEIESYLIETL